MHTHTQNSGAGECTHSHKDSHPLSQSARLDSRDAILHDAVVAVDPAATRPVAFKDEGRVKQVEVFQQPSKLNKHTHNESLYKANLSSCCDKLNTQTHNKCSYETDPSSYTLAVTN